MADGKIIDVITCPSSGWLGVWIDETWCAITMIGSTGGGYIPWTLIISFFFLWQQMEHPLSDTLSRCLRLARPIALSIGFISIWINIIIVS